jgi:hypothetical protein
MDLCRDISDKLVMDRDGRELGRVDRVLLDLRPDGPRVVAIEIGPSAYAARLWQPLGRWVAAIEQALGFEGRPLRVSVSDIVATEPHVRVNVSFADTPAAVVEAALRRRFPRVPGAR